MNLSVRKISNLMQDSKPVFIVGAARSGTSILYRTLQRHSRFYPQKCQSLPTVDLTESNIFKDPYSSYSLSYSSHQSALNYMLGTQEYYQKFLQQTSLLQKKQCFLLGKQAINKIIPLISLGRQSLWLATGNDLLVQVFFYYAQQARGMDRILEKTPQHIYRLPEIKATFPKAKLIFMPRHPIDVYSSYRQRLQKELELNTPDTDLKWLQISPQSFCWRYAFCMHIAHQEKIKNQQRFFLITYEDFTKHTEAKLREILDFLDEPYEEACLLEDESQKLHWQADPKLFESIQNNKKKWQEFISETEASWIENKLAKTMQKLGYSRYT